MVLPNKSHKMPAQDVGASSDSVAIVLGDIKGPVMERIALDRIIDGDNCRHGRTPEKFAELVASIREHGVLHKPHVLDLDDGTYRALIGFGRIQAMRELGWTHCEFIIHGEPLSEEGILRLQLEENETGEKLNAVDLGLGWKVYMQRTGKTVSQLAEERGVSRKTINRCLAIANGLPDEALDLIRSSKLGSSIAEIITKADPTKRLELCRTAVEQGLTREDVKNLVNQSKNPSAWPTTGAGGKRFTLSETTDIVTLTLHIAEVASLSDIQLALEDLLKSVKTVAKSKQASPDTLRTYLAKKHEQARLQAEAAETAEALNRLIEQNA